MSAHVPPSGPPGPVGPEPPDDDALAGELVLGVLGDVERGAALQRRRTDASFAAHAAAWERRLAPWLTEVAPVPVPEELWEEICRELGWRRGTSPPSLWASLALWRTVAALALVAAIALWVTRLPAPLNPPSAAVPAGTAQPVASFVTLLAHNDGSPGWLATVDRVRGTVLMVPVPASADAQGRVPELWIIPAGQAPRSLGAVSINQAHTALVPADSRAALAAPGSILAITLEPAAGIPHPAPSGPIIAKGAISS